MYYLVSLTQVRKKGMDFKKEIVETVKNYVNDYQNIFIFNYENLKTARFQKIREEWQSSKYVKNKAKLNRVYLFLNLLLVLFFLKILFGQT